MKSIFYLALTLSALAVNKGFSQEKKSGESKETNEKSNVVMTWNKDTPEQEMKDDIKALSEYGITISYSNVKRNENKEITAIKVEYADKNGSKGAMEVDNQKPINTIRVFKQGDEVGFGAPANGDFLAGNDFGAGQNFMKQFKGGPNGHSFNFAFPENGSWGNSSSKIIIQNDGKKPLVIEDGKVVEGGDDYSAEELEKIKNDTKLESFGGADKFKFNFDADGNMNELNEQMEKMQEELNQLLSKDRKEQGSEDEQTIKELKQAKEEMLKAKEEMEKTTKELKKAKSSLKTQKA